jgi:hypothetical protein
MISDPIIQEYLANQARSGRDRAARLLAKLEASDDYTVNRDEMLSDVGDIVSALERDGRRERVAMFIMAGSAGDIGPNRKSWPARAAAAVEGADALIAELDKPRSKP